MKNLTISNFGKTSGANWGGTIYTDGNLNLDNVALNSNAVRGGIVSGGAITSVGKAVTNIMGNSSFSKNNAYDYGRGGAIYNLASTIITAADGKSISFSENHAVNQGGAIFSGVYTGNNANLVGVGTLDIKTEGTGSVLFTGNTANYGGAIANSGTATIICDAIKFESNSAKNGGALYLDKNVNFNIENSVFRKNCTSADNGNGWGGAIGLGTNGNINGYVENSLFERNYAGDAGGVVAANTAITFVNPKFINNSARFSGGAISYNPQNSSVGKYLKLIADGADTVFAGNNVTESAGSGLQNKKGQEGIYIGNYTDVTSENDSIVYFNAGNSGSLIFNDIVNAAGGAKDDNGKPYTRNGINKNIQLNRDGVSYGKLEPTSANATTNLAPTNGKIIFNNTVRGANLVLHNGTLAFGQSNSYGSYVEAENVGKYLTDGAKITLKGGTLDLLNKHIESSYMIAPENLNVLGEANLWLDIELDRNENGSLKGAIDKINSDIIGNGKLPLSKFSFKDSKLPSSVDFSKANFDAGKFTTKLTFANNNTFTMTTKAQ